MFAYMSSLGIDSMGYGSHSSNSFYGNNVFWSPWGAAWNSVLFEGLANIEDIPFLVHPST